MVQLPLALVGLVYVLAWANNCAIIKATWCGQVIVSLSSRQRVYLVIKPRHQRRDAIRIQILLQRYISFLEVLYGTSTVKLYRSRCLPQYTWTSLEDKSGQTADVCNCCSGPTGPGGNALQIGPEKQGVPLYYNS